MTTQPQRITLAPGEERREVEGLVELRTEGEGESARRLLHGVAVRYGTLSTVLWQDYRTGKPVRERFAAGAFAGALARQDLDVVARVHHDDRYILGRSRSAASRPATLSLRETEAGLEYSVALPDTSYARDLVELVERGDIYGSSFVFISGEADEAWEERDDELIRTVLRVTELRDVAPLPRPAYQDTEVAIRCAQQRLEAWRGSPAAEHDHRLRELEILALA